MWRCEVSIRVSFSCTDVIYSSDSHCIFKPNQAVKLPAYSLNRTSRRLPSSSATSPWVLVLPMGWYGNGLEKFKIKSTQYQIKIDLPIFWHKNKSGIQTRVLDTSRDNLLPDSLEAFPFLCEDRVEWLRALWCLCCSNSCMDVVDLLHC
jgi:hypothetical protein